MASTVWKGYISFGLISIPVRLFAAARDVRVSFNQVHKVCNSRVKQQLFCPVCERVVERNEIGRGYAEGKDTYIMIEDEELKKIAPASSETMEISQFVKLDEIDPVYFDASYYVVPEEPGRKAYQLLCSSMEKMEYVAMAQVTMHSREYSVAVRPYEHGLTLHTMFYANEVRAIAEYENQQKAELKQQEVDMAEKLIQALAKPFEPETLHDEYQKRVLELIESKSEGKTVAATVHKHRAPVIDLMKALEESLAGVKESGKSLDRKPSVQTSKPHRVKAPANRRAAG